MLSVVIPTFNIDAALAARIQALCNSGVIREVVVSDSDSADGALRIVEDRGTRIVSGQRGRGQQLASGAIAATGEWLLFLHADSDLCQGWSNAVEKFLAAPSNHGFAAYFRLRFDDENPAARRIERLVAWRSRTLGLPYGDQGLLIHRSLYEQIGGYSPIPLMEDVDLVRRIGKHRLTALDADITTSAERYRRDGWWFRPARNLLCLALFFCRVPPRIIARIYG